MEPNQQKLIDDQLKTLPVPLQRAIAITPWRKLVGEVAQKNSLDAEKSEKLEMEAMLVMYGFEAAHDLAANIARELGVDQSLAKKLEDEVEIRVFSVVLAKANSLAQESEETLQSEPAVINNELPVITNKPPINLIKPTPVQTPINLAPVAKPVNMIADKLGNVSASQSKPSQYPGGLDPYREPIQ